MLLLPLLIKFGNSSLVFLPVEYVLNCLKQKNSRHFSVMFKCHHFSIILSFNSYSFSTYHVIIIKESYQQLGLLTAARLETALKHFLQVCFKRTNKINYQNVMSPNEENTKVQIAFWKPKPLNKPSTSYLKQP